MGTIQLEHLPFETDEGVARRARLGLVALSTDYTVEHEYRAVLRSLPGVALYTARIANETTITPRSLAAMEAGIAPSAETLLPGDRIDVIAYGCTSASMVIGEDRVRGLLRGVKPMAEATTPITAAKAAFDAFGARRIGVLTPYTADVNAGIQACLEDAGYEVPVFGSFNEPSDPVVAAISPKSIRAACQRIRDAASFDALFVSCTSVRLLEEAKALEDLLGVPVTSSNHAMIWHCLRLAGVDDLLPEFGSLYGLGMAQQG